MNDQELVAIVSKRSGISFIAPQRELSEKEKDVLLRFIKLGYPYPSKAAHFLILEVIQHFEFECDTPGKEHNIPNPPPAKNEA